MSITYNFDEFSLSGMKNRNFQFILVFIFLCIIMPYIYIWGANHNLPVL